MTYTSVLFDLDNTLLDFTAGEACAVSRVLADNGLPHDSNTVKTYSKINQSYWERFEKGEIPKDAIFTGRFGTLLETLGLEGNPKKISDEYRILLSYQHQTVDGAEDVLKYLKVSGYKVYVTTNGVSSTQYRRIHESGLENYFDGVFVSENAGHQKPEKEYFDYVIDGIPEKDRSRMIIIGDSQSSDILGGINSGIDTCWYNPKGLEPKYPSRFQIKTLLEIKNCL